MEITGAGYEVLKKSELFFAIPYHIQGELTTFQLYIEIIAESREDAIKWIKAKHPTYVVN